MQKELIMEYLPPLYTYRMATPSTTRTAEVKKYEDWRYGWIIHYGINQYNGHWASQFGQQPPNPSIFTATNVDVDSWVEKALEAGIDYAVLTITNEYGFQLFPHTIPYNITGWNPPYPYYCVPPTADQHIVDKFVTKFRAAGIEPIPYFSYVTNSNLRQPSDYPTTFGIMSGTTREQAISFYERLLEEIHTRFNFNYYWFDLADAPYNDVQQRLYDKLKSLNSNIVIMGNNIGEANFERYPYDMGSTEEYAIYGGNVNYQNKLRVKNGIIYYVGQEIVGTPYGSNSQWYYYDNLCPVQPPYTKMLAQSKAQFQGIVDKARDVNIPFLSLMMVDRNGDLVQETIDYLADINFYNKKASMISLLL